MLYKKKIFWFFINIISFGLGLYFLSFSIYGNSGYNELLKIKKMLLFAMKELDLLENRKAMLDKELSFVYRLDEDEEFLDEKLKENFSLIYTDEIVIFDKG